MIESFLVVGMQVLILFVLIALGFLAGKVKIINDTGVRCINDIMLYIVNPCVIINAFQRPFEQDMFGNLLKVTGAAFLGHFVFVALAFLLINKGVLKKNEASGAFCEQDKYAVLRFSIIFSNCGFMALPLLDALLGEEGVFYGAGYLIAFNVLVWSMGQYMMAKDGNGFSGSFSTKKILVNPGIIACVVGVIFFVTSISLPEVILSPIQYLAALNTPVPMLIIGYTISQMDLRGLFNAKEGYIAIILRLVVCPMLVLGILYGIGFRGTILITAVVSASAPVGAMTTMFALKFNKDVELSSKVVSLSTLFSAVTMTLIVGFARYIA